jgi:hypothetical protein
MTKRDLVGVGIAVTGVVLVAVAVANAPSQVGSVFVTARIADSDGRLPTGVLAATTILTILIPIIVGLALALRSTKMSSLVVREDASLPSLDCRRDAGMILSLAFRVLGVVLAVYGIIELLGDMSSFLLSTYYVAQIQEESLGSVAHAFSGDVWSTMWVEVIKAVLALLMGAYLAIRGHALAGLLMRNRGEAVPTEQP